jgi:hypothetical protein
MPITIDGNGIITGAATLATTVANPTFTTPNINSAQFATVSGTAPIYPCRAWVNFNGTGTVAIRASGNVTSITDNGTGDYTVNFTTAMPDANYNSSGNFHTTTGGTCLSINMQSTGAEVAPTTTAFRFISNSTTGVQDSKYISLSFFR